MLVETKVQKAAALRTKRGARWLDENFPDWETRINIETLSLNDASHCICGQVFKHEADSESGYSYAHRTLFTEANSWITGLIGMKPNSARKNIGGWETVDERRSRVSIALGFDTGVLSSSRYSGLDKINVNYEDLQLAWVNLLAKRAAAKQLASV